MADITTNTLKIGDNNLILRDADAQAKLTTNTQNITQLQADTNQLKEDFDELQRGGYIADAQQIQEKVDNWLEENPEATTTVQDGSLTENKFSETLKHKTINDYVTPQMYGAKGDGTTDDINAFNNALLSGKPVVIPSGTYRLSNTLTIPHNGTIKGQLSVVARCRNQSRGYVTGLSDFSCG